jgi:four helix bundle protein
MLRVYQELLEIIRALRPVFEEIGRHDPDLARQGNRALPSAALNTAEGSRSRGKNRNARYSDAAGSLQESIAVLEVAEASGFLRGRPERELAKMLHIANTLSKCARAGR